MHDEDENFLEEDGGLGMDEDENIPPEGMGKEDDSDMYDPEDKYH